MAFIGFYTQSKAFKSVASFHNCSFLIVCQVIMLVFMFITVRITIEKTIISQVRGCTPVDLVTQESETEEFI